MFARMKCTTPELFLFHVAFRFLKKTYILHVWFSLVSFGSSGPVQTQNICLESPFLLLFHLLFCSGGKQVEWEEHLSTNLLPETTTSVGLMVEPALNESEPFFLIFRMAWTSGCSGYWIASAFTAALGSASWVGSQEENGAEEEMWRTEEWQRLSS